MADLVAKELERAATTLLADRRDGVIKELLDDKVLVSRFWWISQRSRVTIGPPLKDYLLRVFVDIDREPPAVVTAYRTSKIEKYWREAE